MIFTKTYCLSSRIGEALLESLIKLSKELFEMELIKESLEIDGLIHKLYGVGGTSPSSYDETYSFEEESYDLQTKESSLDDLKSIIINSNSEEFRACIPEILIESLNIYELELIKEAITDYLE